MDQILTRMIPGNDALQRSQAYVNPSLREGGGVRAKQGERVRAGMGLWGEIPSMLGFSKSSNLLSRTS